MTTRDRAQNQIRENRKIMSGLPENSPQWKALQEENSLLGQSSEATTEDRRTGGPTWFVIADVLTELTCGYGTTYESLGERDMYKSLIASETRKIWDAMWEMYEGRFQVTTE